MAGIGFRLQKLLDSGTYYSTLQAYFYAAVISSGPLVLSIGSLALLGIVVRSFSGPDLALFFASVTMIYSGSMILTGVVQVVMVRCAADADYVGHRETIWPLITRCLGFVVPAHVVIAGWFFFFGVEADNLYRLGCVFLAVQVGIMWLFSGLLTGLKDYGFVTASFAIGYLASFLLGWLGFQIGGLPWLMIGFALGHAVLVTCLLMAIRREIPAEADTKGRTLGKAMSMYRTLAMCGLAYNVGIWADKYLFWWLGEGRVQISGLLYSMPLHDQAVYLGFLSIIPGMAVFLLRFETEFSARYAEYFRRVVEKESLAAIEEAKKDMLASIWGEIVQLVKYQGTVTLLLLLLADRVMPPLGLSALQTGVFQIIILGSFLLVLFLSLLTVLFYLDEQRSALVCCTAFAATNIAVTTASIFSGEQWFGIGYVAACAVGLALSAKLADDHIRELTYKTFSKQPLFPDTN